MMKNVNKNNVYEEMVSIIDGIDSETQMVDVDDLTDLMYVIESDTRYDLVGGALPIAQRLKMFIANLMQDQDDESSYAKVDLYAFSDMLKMADSLKLK